MRGSPRLPPGDFAARTFPHVPARGTFYRCAVTARPLLDWDDRATSRFSSPTLPFPVLYLSESRITGFWECFGDELNDQPDGHKALYRTKHLAPRQWVRFQIRPPLRVIDVTKAATLRKMGADAGTFLAEYAVTQRWVEALMSHPANLDGFFYRSRLDGEAQCLAVFGRPHLLRAHKRFGAKADGLLLKDTRLLLFLAEQDIGVL